MKAFLILIISVLLNTSMLFSQSENKIVSEAENLFNLKHYVNALPLYLDLLKADPNNSGLNYKTGVCYMNSRSQKHKAINYLEKAIAFSASLSNKSFTKEKGAPATVYKLLGDAYLLTFKFEAAITAYEKYKAALKTNKLKDTLSYETINRKIEMCLYGKEFEESAGLPTHFNPAKHRDTSITKEPDTICGNYSSKLSADRSSLIYTFKIPLMNVKLPEEDDRYFEQMYYTPLSDSAFLKQASLDTKKADNNIGPDTIINITTIGTSVDGQIVLSYKDDKGDGSVYLSRLIGNNWTAPEKLPKGLNDKGWEFCENVSPDGSTLYFVSNRPGGFGGNDIYKCKKLPNGEWSKAINLGSAINSPFNDEAPFMHPDGVTLYFSSNRNKPAASYDNFMTTLSENESWTKPVIVGYPNDKNSDKAFYQVIPGKNIPISKEPEIVKNKKARKDTLKNTAAEKDNFVITFFNSNKKPLTILTGKVVHSSGKLPDNLLITVSDNLSAEVCGLYYPDKNGHYSFILPPGKNNNITFEAESCLFLSDNISADNSGPLRLHSSHLIQPLTEESKTFLNNIFFKPDSSDLSPLSKVELNNILFLLLDHPDMKVKITNYIFSRESKKDLKQLSWQRARQVGNYLIEKGIDKKRISVKGYKKSDPNKNSSETGNFFSNENQVTQRLELKIKTMKSKIK
jgi:outer membrane protein OmpA-like peptidoglycan-associated protein/tetratricopeptide (TPR) repeat protein